MRPTALGLLLVLSLPAAAVGAPYETLDVWWRPTTGAPVRTAVNLRKLPVQEVEKYDIQYDRKLRFRGVPLGAVFKGMKRPMHVDAVVVRFANGMAAPISLAEADDLFLAFDWIAPETAKVEPIDWKNEFPLPIEPGGKGKLRPIKFAKNKVVCSTHLEEGDATFIPWRYADSVIGLELIQRSAYDAQFLPGDASPSAKKGFAIYRRTCMNCHGIREEGATFGWDLVEPVPLAEHRRSAGQLYYHVRYRELGATDRGIMMPALPSITEADAKHVFEFFQAVAKAPLAPYRPGI